MRGGRILGEREHFFWKDFSGAESFFYLFYGRWTGKRDCLLDFLFGFFLLGFFLMFSIFFWIFFF